MNQNATQLIQSLRQAQGPIVKFFAVAAEPQRLEQNTPVTEPVEVTEVISNLNPVT